MVSGSLGDEITVVPGRRTPDSEYLHILKNDAETEALDWQLKVQSDCRQCLIK
jgi:hypothetical protein